MNIVNALALNVGHIFLALIARPYQNGPKFSFWATIPNYCAVAVYSDSFPLFFLLQ